MVSAKNGSRADHPFAGQYTRYLACLGQQELFCFDFRRQVKTIHSARNLDWYDDGFSRDCLEMLSGALLQKWKSGGSSLRSYVYSVSGKRRKTGTVLFSVGRQMTVAFPLQQELFYFGVGRQVKTINSARNPDWHNDGFSRDCLEILGGALLQKWKSGGSSLRSSVYSVSGKLRKTGTVLFSVRRQIRRWLFR